MSQNYSLLARVEQHLTTALEQVAPDEDLTWGVSLTVVPGAAPDTFDPLLLIVLTAPATAPGERMYANLMSFDMHPSQEAVREIVQGGVDQMREEREQARSGLN